MDRYHIVLEKPIIKELSTADALTRKVRTRLNEYLGFDVDTLLRDTDAVVFGGAVRDSLAEMEIHDVDIMALPRAAANIANRLVVGMGFKRVSLSTVDVATLYAGVKVINEPWTYLKNKAIVQVIRPAIRYKNPISDLNGLLSNVDISACGVTYNGSVGEVVKLAIEDCCNKRFAVIPYASMCQNNRIHIRTAKLEDRGWKQYENIKDLRAWSNIVYT